MSRFGRGPSGRRHQGALQVERGALGRRQPPCVPDVDAREARREVQGGPLVVVEPLAAPHREQLPVRLARPEQRYRDHVRGPAPGTPGPRPRDAPLVRGADLRVRGAGRGGVRCEGARRTRPRGVQQLGGTDRGHPFGPAALAGQVYGSGVAHGAGQETSQLPAGLPLVARRADLVQGLFHRVQARPRTVPLRHDAAVTPSVRRPAPPRNAFHQPSYAAGGQGGACLGPGTPSATRTAYPGREASRVDGRPRGGRGPAVRRWSASSRPSRP